MRFAFGGISVGVGDAARGVCGGMVFAARDLFEAGLAPGPDAQPPEAGSPLFRYIVRRMFDSFDLPRGPVKYMRWMVAAAAAGSRSHVVERSVRAEWPSVKRDIDSGVPSPLGLVRTTSRSPMDLGHNHQVLAYGYSLDEAGDLVIRVYDPNHPGDDAIALRVGTGAARSAGIRYVEGEPPVYGFFRTPYSPPSARGRGIRTVLAVVDRE